MGYTDDRLQLNVRLSRHNDERDARDDAAFEALKIDVWALIMKNDDYKRIVKGATPW